MSLVRQPDRHASPVSRGGIDLERSSCGFDPDPLRGETDVPVGEAFGEPLKREAPAVVFYGELDFAVLLDEAHGEPMRAGMADDVTEQLSRS